VPLYDLYEEVSVKDINTKATHNIDEIRTNIRYYVSDPRLAVTGIPDRAQAEEEIAKDLKQELREARLAPVFWEKLLGSQLSRDAAEIIRTVVFNGQYTAPQAYDRREEVQQDIFERLQSRVESWGILIRRVDLEYVKVDGERFKALNWEPMLERESYVKQIESERDALRIRNVLSAEVDAESRRVTEIIKALRDSGVDITPDLIVRAITATSDWQVEGDFSLLTQQAPPPPVVPAPPKPPEKPAEKK
jgi:regulator of protease activity HflC (stomatin/prohibitin superfamily)